MRWEAILWDKLDCNPIVPRENRRCCIESVFQEFREGRLYHSWVKLNQKARITEKSNEVLAQTDGFKCKPDCVAMSVFLSTRSSETGASVCRFMKPTLLLQETYSCMHGDWATSHGTDHLNYGDKSSPFKSQLVYLMAVPPREKAI